jgi:hypothetical protein
MTRVFRLTILIAVVICTWVDKQSAHADAATSTSAAPMAASAAPIAVSANTVPIASAAGGIPDGTRITVQNWQQYRQFMPDGMAAFFEGRYFWKMPADVAMDVGPTMIHPLPKGYVEATEKYASQVKIVELPGGGLTLEGYQGGIPFPNPQEPHKGWKILANLWFRYEPHLTVNLSGNGCAISRNGSIDCQAGLVVTQHLAYNTDPGVAPTIPGSGGKFMTVYYMQTEPEQLRYYAGVTLTYADLARPEEIYNFDPTMRRTQRFYVTSARCVDEPGSDQTWEDERMGFDSNLTEYKVDYLGSKKILALLDYQKPTGKFPDGFDMPLGWPQPSWGKWQLRDVDVISARKIDSKAGDYCFGKRIMYIDKQISTALWVELYDKKEQPWRFAAFFPHTENVPGVGPVNNSSAAVFGFWDLQNDHATILQNPAEGHALYINDQAPKQYLDLNTYCDPAGLDTINR